MLVAIRIWIILCVIFCVIILVVILGNMHDAVMGGAGILLFVVNVALLLFCLLLSYLKLMEQYPVILITLLLLPSGATLVLAGVVLRWFI
jgi:hypothetical protein